MQRTEAQKVNFEPIKVRLGSKDYEIRPLRAAAQRNWRRRFQEELQPIVDELKIAEVNNRTFMLGLVAVFQKFPEKVEELIFAYAPYLPESEIMDENSGASEEQLCQVFSDIYDLAFGSFLAQLGKVTSVLAPNPASATRITSPSPSGD